MKDIKDIGRALVDYAEDAEAFTTRRGIVEELFPFIYEASQRMSLRAISRWLASEKNISVTPQALSKAMRNPGKYWIRILEGIEPAARLLARAHNLSPSQILTDTEALDLVKSKPPAFENPNEETFRRYDDALQLVGEFKAGMPVGAYRACLAYVGKVFDEQEQDRGPK